MSAARKPPTASPPTSADYLRRSGEQQTRLHKLGYTLGRNAGGLLWVRGKGRFFMTESLDAIERFARGRAA